MQTGSVAKLIDFGAGEIECVAVSGSGQSSTTASPTSKKMLTGHSTVVGIFYYISPAYVEGESQCGE